MDDLISRQAAISAICNACGKIDCDKMDKCEKLQLPPANCSEFPNNSDTISRQAAIDAIMGRPPEPHYPSWYAAQIEKLPAVQPLVIHCTDCEDWLERQSILGVTISELPSAQPTIEPRKKGKWIPQDYNKTNGITSTLVYYYPKCSVCGHCDNYTNFCSNCGADMRGEQDE